MPKANKVSLLYNQEKSSSMNPNETRGTEGEKEEMERTCPNCGMEQKDWSANEGQGFTQRREFYCCEGCAEGTGCTCADEA